MAPRLQTQESVLQHNHVLMYGMFNR